MSQAQRDYERVARAVDYLASEAPRAPSLEDVAGVVGLSPFHCQRLFSRWAGLSPGRFVKAMAAQRARRALQAAPSVLEASLDADLAPGRLHELLLSVEGMTPGDYRTAAEGVVIDWGTFPTMFGDALIARTARGVCAVSFGAGGESALRARWPGATIRERPAAVRELATLLEARMRGARGEPLSVVLRGTPFQLQVWDALLRIPPGTTVTYGALARAIGRPKASRAVGSAVGDNPLAWLIPCHRVIRASGALGDYRWGATRKAVMLTVEAASHDARQPLS